MSLAVDVNRDLIKSFYIQSFINLLIRMGIMQFQTVMRTAQYFGLSILSLSVVHLANPAISVAQVCNFYGCSAPGAGECNFHGCPNPGAAPCNFHGCPAAPPSTNNAIPSVPSSAQPSRSFQVVNNSGVEIYYLYVSPTGQDAWSDDVLGSNTLPNGQFWNLNLSQGCRYDFWAEQGNGSRLVWRNIDVCQRSSIILNR